MNHLSNILSSDSITDEQIDDLHRYHDDPSKQPRYDAVREACIILMKAVRDHAPRCSDRTRAFQAIRDARMLANSAIALERNA